METAHAGAIQVIEDKHTAALQELEQQLKDKEQQLGELRLELKETGKCPGFEEQLRKLTADLETTKEEHVAAMETMKEAHTASLQEKAKALNELRTKCETQVVNNNNNPPPPSPITIEGIMKNVKLLPINTKNNKTTLKEIESKLKMLAGPSFSPPSPPNGIQEGFTDGELEQEFVGGARRTKKKRRRNNKTKLVRRPQNRTSRKKTSRKRNKN